jgi:glutathione S-transferase
VRHSARFRASHPETIAEFRPRAEAALSFVDKTVKDQPFLVGDCCTIADLGCWGRMGSPSWPDTPPSGVLAFFLDGSGTLKLTMPRRGRS